MLVVAYAASISVIGLKKINHRFTDELTLVAAKRAINDSVTMPRLRDVKVMVKWVTNSYIHVLVCLSHFFDSVHIPYIVRSLTMYVTLFYDIICFFVIFFRLWAWTFSNEALKIIS